MSFLFVNLIFFPRCLLSIMQIGECEFGWELIAVWLKDLRAIISFDRDLVVFGILELWLTTQSMLLLIYRRLDLHFFLDDNWKFGIQCEFFC